MKKTIGFMALVLSAATALVPAAMARDWDDHDGDRGRYSYQVETRTDGYQGAYRHGQREWMPQDRYTVHSNTGFNSGRSNYQRNDYQRNDNQRNDYQPNDYQRNNYQRNDNQRNRYGR
jgi:hypothetical protein